MNSFNTIATDVRKQFNTVHGSKSRAELCEFFGLQIKKGKYFVSDLDQFFGNYHIWKDGKFFAYVDNDSDLQEWSAFIDPDCEPFRYGDNFTDLIKNICLDIYRDRLQITTEKRRAMDAEIDNLEASAKAAELSGAEHIDLTTEALNSLTTSEKFRLLELVNKIADPLNLDVSDLAIFETWSAFFDMATALRKNLDRIELQRKRSELWREFQESRTDQ